MLTISKNQMEYMNLYFRERFLDELVEIHKDLSKQRIEEIVDEALGFNIDEEKDVSRYVELYLNYKSQFEEKPRWMWNTLSNENYLAKDKLEHIALNLVE